MFNINKVDYKSFDFLQKLYFVRTGGSVEEDKAADIIVKECEELGVSAVKESFLVDGFEPIKCSLSFIDPDFDVECAPVGMTSSTPEEGIIAPFTYVDSLEDAQIQDLEGKICLVHSKLVNNKLYKEIVQKNAKGLILCTGSVYNDKELVDLDPYINRERNYQYGKIPAVCIRMKDAERLLRQQPSKVKLVMVEEEKQKESHNVIATIKGTEYENEIVAFTAHYDSVSYSKGAYDNATGSTGIMQLLAFFKENPPKRTLKFIWCGSEEMGLLGSINYTKMHKEELNKYKLCINIDMIGVQIGFDIARATSNVSLVNYVKYLACQNGFAIKASQGVYSSDSTPFADNGVPSISFARIAPTGGAEIHSRKDVIDFLEPINYYRTCDFIALFASNLINSVVFPVEQTIPDNMKLEIDYYFYRKDRE